MGAARGAGVTPREVTHRGPAWRRHGTTLAPMLTIVIARGDFGEDPLLLREGDGVPGGETRWRLVAQTDDEEIAAGVMELMVRRCCSEPPGCA